MPSFRASLAVHRLRPGHAPEEVLEVAVAAVGSLHHVDADRLDIVRGVPRIGVRFTVDPTGKVEAGDLARRAAHVMADAVDGVATWSSPRLEVMDRGRWRPVMPA